MAIKNEILPFVVTWRYLEVFKLNEVSQTEKTNLICHHLHVDSKKNDANKLIYKTKRLTDIENKFSYQRRKEGGGVN